MMKQAKDLSKPQYKLRADAVKIEQYLERIHEEEVNSDAPHELYDYLLSVRKSLTSLLDETIQAPAHPSEDVSDVVDLERDLAAFADNLKATAERLWRDEFKGKPRRDQQTRLVSLTRYTRLLMRLWFEATCYYERVVADSRFRAPIEIEPEQKDEIRDTVEAIHKAAVDYRRDLNRWNKELQPIVKRSLLRIERSDAEHRKSLARIFGPDGISIDEPGWIGYATNVGDELRYQYFDLRVRTGWQMRRFRFIGAAVLRIIGITTGYGMRPWRFAGTVLFWFLAFFAAYFTLDATQGSQCYPAALTLSSLLNHAYLTITNMTSLGSSPAPCSPATKALSGFESIIGYFLLAILVALLYEKLSESE